MKYKILAALCVLALTACLTGCLPNDGRPSMNSDTWYGKWDGPEGTSLLIEKDKLHYKLTITNLDGPRAFRGDASRGGIEFMRDKELLTIHPGTGTDTGMKWLSDKKTCLVIKFGEGYCRG